MAIPFLKLSFITDIHGSTSCFKKFINTARRTDPPDVLIIGGDITGKFVVPFISSGRGPVIVDMPSKKLTVNDKQAADIKADLIRSGCYIYLCDPDAYKVYTYDEGTREAVFRSLQIERLQEWLAIANERLHGGPTTLYINVGNDDPFYIDPILESAGGCVRFPDRKLVNLPQGLILVSVGYSSPTPWKCERELPEPELRRCIANLAQQVRAGGSFDRCIFNFHCPPKDTRLDLAPKLDGSLRPVVGVHGPEFEHVGSEAVREAIKDFQPPLSLHGHIHEQRVIEKLGNTVCVNPGSSYWTGSLQGFVATFKDGILMGSRLTSEISTDENVGKIIAAGVKVQIPIVGHSLVAMEHQQEINELHREASEMKRENEELKKKVEGIESSLTPSSDRRAPKVDGKRSAKRHRRNQ